MTAELSGVRVLVTRPRHQADGLCRLIEAAGGEPIVFPVLEIGPPPDPQALDALLARLGAFHLAIFISANAVQAAVARLGGSWPAGVKIAAVGRATAEALRTAGLPVDVVPTGRYDSEGLLSTEAVQEVSGQRIVIFRGDGGREHLAETLRSRGAEVQYAECYQRLRPQGDDLAALDRLQRGEIDLAVVTSCEGLANLFDMVGTAGQELLRALPIVLISERAAEAARQLGVQQPLVATEASDAGILEAMVRWRRAAVSEKGRGMTNETQPGAATLAEVPPAAPAAAVASPAEPTTTTPTPEPGPKPAAPPAAPKRPAAKSASQVPLWVALLLVTAGAGGGLAYLYQTQRQLSQNHSAHLAQLDQRLAAVAQNGSMAAYEQLQGAVVNLDSRLTELQGLGARIEELGPLPEQFATLQTTLAEIQQRQTELTTATTEQQQVLTSLQERLGRGPKDWAVAEAEFLLRTAADHLNLRRDPATALRALQEADALLARANDAGIRPVRDALAGEIAALQAVQVPDVSGTAKVLTALGEDARQLPLKGSQPERIEAAPAAPEAVGFWDKIWSGLKSLVVVRRGGEPVEPLMAPEQQAILQQNLQARLESARLALLRGEQPLWTDSISAVRAWVERYYDPASPVTAGMLATLAKLQELTVAPPLPDVSTSLRLLGELQQKAPAPKAAAGAATP